MPVRAFRRELRAGYLAPFLAMLLLAVMILWLVSAQVLSVEWVEHSDEVIRDARHAQTDLLKMTVVIRSYWLISDSRYLTMLEESERDLDATLAKISILVADNPTQSQRLLEVRSLKGKWLGATQTLIAQGNGAQATKLALTNLDDRVQAESNVLDEIVGEEDQLLKERKVRQRIESRLIFLLVPLLSVLAAVVLAYWGWAELNTVTEKFGTALSRAEDANRAKDTFLVTVSHELRNPLNLIMLLSGLALSDRELGENARQKVRGIERAARSQAQLIEDLLDISRIESGRMRLDVQATDLAQVVKGGVESMRVAAEAKAITLHEIIDPNVSLIAGDPKRLEQVVFNLVSNAVKFTLKGGKVEVRLQRINSHVEIVVGDNGQGIAPSSLSHVFDRFWQETNTAGRNPGVGLGLSVVKELVTLHGGTVMVHSEGIGKGSTFTVRLPLPVAKAPLLEPRRHPTAAPTDNIASVARLDGLSIMVVDDEREARDVLTKLLGSLGASVSAATSAQDALGKLAGAHLDAIVADIGMPVEDGSFLAREVRKREADGSANGSIPLVALTAYGRVEDKIKILAGGFDGHVVKPVDLAELSATIRSLVAARRM